MKKMILFLSILFFFSSCIVLVPRVEKPNKGYTFRKERGGYKFDSYPKTKKFNKRKLYRKMYK